MTDTTTADWRTESRWPNATDVQLAEKATNIIYPRGFDRIGQSTT